MSEQIKREGESSDIGRTTGNNVNFNTAPAGTVRTSNQLSHGDRENSPITTTKLVLRETRNPNGYVDFQHNDNNVSETGNKTQIHVLPQGNEILLKESEFFPDLEYLSSIFEKVKNSNLLLVLFYMPKCPACVRAIPILNGWIDQFANQVSYNKKIIQFGKVNIYNPKNMDINMFAKIQSCPTLGLFWENPYALQLKRMTIPKEWMNDYHEFQTCIENWTMKDWMEEISDDLTQIFPPISEQKMQELKKRQQMMIEAKRKQVFTRPSIAEERNKIISTPPVSVPSVAPVYPIPPHPAVSSILPEPHLQINHPDVVEIKSGSPDDAEKRDPQPPNLPYDTVESPVTWMQICVSIVLCTVFVIIFSVLVAELINFIIPRVFHSHSFRKINWITGLSIYVLTILLKH